MRFESRWTNWPATVLFGAGMIMGVLGLIFPVIAREMGLGRFGLMVVMPIWLVLAVSNARRTLIVTPGGLELRCPGYTLARVDLPWLDDVLVRPGSELPWWRRWWIGCGARPVLLVNSTRDRRCVLGMRVVHVLPDGDDRRFRQAITDAWAVRRTINRLRCQTQSPPTSGSDNGTTRRVRNCSCRHSRWL